MLKPNGKLLTVATDSSTTERFSYVEPNRAELVEIAALIDGGKIQPIVGVIAALVCHFFDRTKTR